MDPSKAHYTLSHGQVAHVDKSERDINVTVATSRVPSEMTVQGQRCGRILYYGKSHCLIKGWRKLGLFLYILPHFIGCDEERTHSSPASYREGVIFTSDLSPPPPPPPTYILTPKPIYVL